MKTNKEQGLKLSSIRKDDKAIVIRRNFQFYSTNYKNANTFDYDRKKKKLRSIKLCIGRR